MGVGWRFHLAFRIEIEFSCYDFCKNEVCCFSSWIKECEFLLLLFKLKIVFTQKGSLTAWFYQNTWGCEGGGFLNVGAG